MFALNQQFLNHRSVAKCICSNCMTRIRSKGVPIIIIRLNRVEAQMFYYGDTPCIKHGKEDVRNAMNTNNPVKVYCLLSGLEVIKDFFVLSSAQHEIFPANSYENANNS